MGTIEKRNIERLCKLLEDAEQRGDRDAASALRWAIMNLEHMHK